MEHSHRNDITHIEAAPEATTSLGRSRQWPRTCLCPRGPAPGLAASLLLGAWLCLSAVTAIAEGSGSDATPATAASPASDSTADLPAGSEIEARIKVAESATDLDEAARSALIERYRRIVVGLESVRGFQARAAELAQSLQDAPAETAEVRKRLDDLEAAPPTKDDDASRLPSAEINQRLGQIQTEIALHQTLLDELANAIDGAPDRMDQVRTRINHLKETLTAIAAEEAQASATADQPAAIAEANRWDLAARRQAASSELRALEQELASADVRTTLARAKRELATHQLESLSEQRRVLETVQSERHRQEAEQAQKDAEAAKQDAQHKHPAIKQVADENAELSETLARLAQSLQGIGDETEQIQHERKRIEEDFSAARQRMKAAGLTRAMGQVLVERRSRLPDLAHYRKELAAGEDRIAEGILHQVRFREEKRLLRNTDALIDKLTLAEPGSAYTAVRDQLRDLIESRRGLLDKAQDAEDDLIRKQSEQNDAIGQLIHTTETFDHFLAEYLLWVRTMPMVGPDTLTALPSALFTLLSPSSWSDVVQVLVDDLRSSPRTWLGLLVSALLLLRSSAIRRAIVRSGEPLRRIRTDHIRYTLRAIALTLLAALPLPILAIVLGRALTGPIEATAFTRALGHSLIFVASSLFFLRALRLLCLSGGVADRHFRWRTNTLAVIRREVRWFTVVLILLGVAAVTAFDLNDAVLSEGFGRLTMVLLLLIVAVFLARLLNPQHGAVAGVIQDHPDGWASRSRKLWYPLLVAIPLALTALTLWGYLYTAGILFEREVHSFWLLLGLLLLQQLIVRWLIMTRRKLALQAALERQAARRAQAEAKEAGGEPISAPPEEPEPDLASLDEQTRRLVNALVGFGVLIGIWLIWADVLPAFNMLEQFALWHYTGIVDGTEQQIPVTVADAALVLLIVIVATVAARNLPALIEIVLLQATSVSAGTRYTARTLLSYTITAAAFLSAFATLGLSWSQVQWLVAALSVGIGFGLQEIVANFVSGIIILFERPVRVGDVITIGDTTGTVTNIQIRATTIRNWDKKELLVPNRELITGHLLNWTLTDQINRVTVTLGIEYGANVELALALLKDIAEAHPTVLDDPAPLISFEGFGDNALTVVLRCYLPSLDNRIGTITELHREIDRRFAENGVVIAFPQRDIHLTAREPLDIRIIEEARQPAGGTTVGSALGDDRAVGRA